MAVEFDVLPNVIKVFLLLFLQKKKILFNIANL